MGKSLREIKAEILSNVNDKVGEFLGFRYRDLSIPGLEFEYPPKITDISTSPFSEATYAQWLSTIDGLPNKVFEIRIPKISNITMEDLNTGESWILTLENGTEVPLRPLDILDRDFYFLVRATILKNKI